jgi:1-acyl-sn-glycerol-3-phosphate acyltransferase
MGQARCLARLVVMVSLFNVFMQAVSFFHVVRLSCMTVGYSLLGISLAPFDTDYRLFYKYGLRFAETALRMANVRVEIEGEGHLRKGQAYVFVANHTGIFDIPAIWVATSNITGGRLRIMYKQDLELVPFLGWVLKTSPFIPVQRNQARDSMKSLQQAIEAIQEGDSVIIFAEGTRSRSGRLMDFKRGAFLLAARAGKPLVPSAIIGSHSVMRSDSLDLHPGTIRVSFGEPVPPPAEHDRVVERSLMVQMHSAVAELLPEEQKPV